MMRNFLIFVGVVGAFIAKPVNATVLNKHIVTEKTSNVFVEHNEIILPYLPTGKDSSNHVNNTPTPGNDVLESTMELYENAKLKNVGLSFEAFNAAYKGYLKLKRQGYVDNEKLAICDFSKASGEKRLYIINPKTQKLIMRTYVAHGKNSGGAYATSFGNEQESNKSSLGFYITSGTYQGANGYSMYLKGMDAGFNDNAYDRSVVMHGADYVNEDAASQGYVGRSFGCPAVSREVHDKVINMLKGGSCLFIYYPSSAYLKKSKWLK